MVSSFVFDIDGTLIDSVDLHAAAWQQAFAHLGKRIAFEAVRSQIGKGGDQLIPFFLTRDENERFGEELDRYRSELFKREYLSQARCFPRVRELFLRIRQDGRKIALASSAKPDEVQIYKDLCNVSDLV